MSHENVPLARLFEQAASALTEGVAADSMEPEVRGLLGALDYLAPDGGRDGDGARILNRVALLRAAAQFGRVFELNAPDAPGLAFIGAEADPSVLEHPPVAPSIVGVSGAGLSRRQAFEACVGEGVEYLSQHDTPLDRLERAPLHREMADCSSRTRGFISSLDSYRRVPCAEVDWIRAMRLADGAAVTVPADICLRRDAERRAIDAPFLLGTGCAAGPTFEAAAVHGLLELIERDAASLWWRGGRRGRVIPAESDAYQVAGALFAQIRPQQADRRSWLLDITTDVGVPCIAAVSLRSDGSGFACGLAAGMTFAAAVPSAVRELCQIELAYAVVQAKREERGDAALNRYDLQHLERSRRIDASCALLHPAPPGAVRPELTEAGDTRALGLLVGRLAQMEIDVLAVDLTRPRFGIPVVRVVAPGLQPEPSDLTTERLSNTIMQAGGGETYTGGVALL